MIGIHCSTYFLVSTLFFSLSCSSGSFITSFADFLNSESVWPTAEPISGNFLGPNKTSTITKMIMSPGTPIAPKFIYIHPSLFKRVTHCFDYIFEYLQRHDRLAPQP